MKLTIGQQFPISDNRVWVYMGYFGGYFTCDICNQPRKFIHEFHLYRIGEPYLRDPVDYSLDTEHCGSECVKKWLRILTTE